MPRNPLINFWIPAGLASLTFLLLVCGFHEVLNGREPDRFAWPLVGVTLTYKFIFSYLRRLDGDRNEKPSAFRKFFRKG